MTRTNSALSVLAREEVFAWASQAEFLSAEVESLFLGNAQGGHADLDDYEVRQMMAERF